MSSPDVGCFVSVSITDVPWELTHWGRVTHICVGNLTIIGPDNGLSPGRRQAIIWSNAGILLIEPWGTNFSEISIGIHTFSFKKIHLKMSCAKWRPFCLGLNVLISSFQMASYVYIIWSTWTGMLLYQNTEVTWLTLNVYFEVSLDKWHENWCVPSVFL